MLASALLLAVLCLCSHYSMAVLYCKDFFWTFLYFFGNNRGGNVVKITTMVQYNSIRIIILCHKNYIVNEKTLFLCFHKLKQSLKKKNHIKTLFFEKVNRFYTWDRPPNIYKVARSVNGGGLMCTALLIYILIFQKSAKSPLLIQ